MATRASFPGQDFAPAPVGTRVRVATTLALGAIVVAFAAVAVLFAFGPIEKPLFALSAIGAGLPLLAGVGYCSRIRSYRLTEDALHVVRVLSTAKIPLAGLREVGADREALAGARKMIGNDGLGAIAGRFRSRKLGTFRAYVTDGNHAVVLRWPDRCLVVSPEKTGQFVDALSAWCAGKGHR